jgi:hypothetical protein
MKKAISLILLVVVLTSFQHPKTLKGTWQFCGGYLNGKFNPSPKGYLMQRKYTASNYEALMLEKGEKPYKYESGNYTMIGDTCLETQTFSALPSQLVNIPVRYAYTMRKDTLILKGKLPNGFITEDLWKKVK